MAMPEPDDQHDAKGERDELMRRLGESLYPVTKDDERFYLMVPDLYLAIARLDGDADDITA